MFTNAAAQTHTLLVDLQRLTMHLAEALGVPVEIRAISLGAGDIYFHLVQPEQTLKIRRASRTITLDDGSVIIVDEGSKGPVGVHLILKKE